MKHTMSEIERRIQRNNAIAETVWAAMGGLAIVFTAMLILFGSGV